MAAREGEKVVIGLANLVIHRVEAEETTRLQRSKTDKGSQRGAPPYGERRGGRSVRLWHSFESRRTPFRGVGLVG